MNKRIALLACMAVGVCGALYLVFNHFKVKSGDKPKLLTAVAGNNQPAKSLSPPATKTNAPPIAKSHPNTRELDITVNPYADALLEPGKSKRSWDANFIKTLQNASSGDAIRFELTEGKMAS